MTEKTWKPISREPCVQKLLELMRNPPIMYARLDTAEELVAEIWQLAQQEQMSLLDAALRPSSSPT